MRNLTLRTFFLLLLSAAGMISIAGCPQDPNSNSNGNTNSANSAPAASAGADQTVTVNALVSLSANGSTDADGDPLSYSWTQTGGGAVTLGSSNTAATSFVAPATPATLVFQVTVSDGTTSATDTVTVTVQASTPTVQPRLYVANFAGNSIQSYLNPATLNGNLAPSTNLAGAQTLLNTPSDMVVTAGNTLIAVNLISNSATSYANADTTNGNIAPAGNVQGAATGLNGPITVALNRANDLIFVANSAGNVILSYNNASTSAFNGNLAPIRTITSANILAPRGINFDSNDTLYVANNAAPGSIAVFDNASTRSGAVTADRVITSAQFNGVFDVFIDNSDRMYVLSRSANQILVFNNASTLNGARTPDSTLTVTGAGSISAIAVDAAGVGYLVDNLLNSIFSYDNIASRNGTFVPDRTLAGANTQLNGPSRLFLVE